MAHHDANLEFLTSSAQQAPVQSVKVKKLREDILIYRGNKNLLSCQVSLGVLSANILRAGGVGFEER